MNWLEKLVNMKYKEQEGEIAKKQRQNKSLKVSFVLDLLKMLVLGLSAIAIIVYIAFYCISQGENALPSFWVSWMSVWVFCFSIGKKLLKNKYRMYVDILFIITMVAFVVIACVLTLNGLYGDILSLIISIIGFSGTIVIETIDSIKMFRSYYDDRTLQTNQEIENLKNKSPMM